MLDYRRCVAGVVYHASDALLPSNYPILLVHKPRKYDAWQLPQGGIEEGEMLAEAMVRELFEETAMQSAEILGVSTHTYQYDFPEDFVKKVSPTSKGQHVSFLFLQTDSPSIVVDEEEIDGYEWIEQTDLAKYIDRQEYLDRVLQVLQEGSSLFV
jgi:putative (di)nucleoside polyphosphate hydrolase